MKKYYLIFYALTFALIVVWVIYGIDSLPKTSQPNYDTSKSTEIVLLWILQLIIIGITYLIGHLLEVKYKKRKRY